MRKARALRRPCCVPAFTPGVFTPEYAYSREDRDGIKFGDELKRIGYLRN